MLWNRGILIKFKMSLIHHSATFYRALNVCKVHHLRNSSWLYNHVYDYKEHMPHPHSSRTQLCLKVGSVKAFCCELCPVPGSIICFSCWRSLFSDRWQNQIKRCTRDRWMPAEWKIGAMLAFFLIQTSACQIDGHGGDIIPLFSVWICLNSTEKSS